MYVSGDINRIAQESLLDAVAGPAFFVGTDYRYLAFNEANRKAVRDLYRTEPEIGASLLDVVSVDEDREAMRADLTRAFAGETHTMGAWFGSGEQGRLYYTITYAPADRDGTVIGAAVVAVESTALIEAREALRLSEQKYEAAFKSSPDAININRMSDGLYLEINDGFTQLTGYGLDDVAGKTSLELSIWDDLADRDRLVAELRGKGWTDRIEATFRRKDGTTTVAEMSARIISIDREPCIVSVTRDIAERKRSEAELRSSHERLERMNRDIVETLGRVVETRDPYTQGHQQRAARLCGLLGSSMGVCPADVEALETAALVHDIGKLSVPAEILTKVGALTELEYALIKEHPRNSYEILKDIAFDGPIADLVLQHHERMDGSGYPSGLVGDAIMFPARILAVADVVEAMATHRPYRPALGLDAAVAELREHPEKYDPEVVTALVALCDAGLVEL